MFENLFSSGNPLAPSHRTNSIRVSVRVLQAVCRMLLFLNKTSTWPLYLEQLMTIPLVTAFFTVYRAALSDVLG